ncbi:MAG: anti-sigma factor [Acidimicrobiia bacterium]
MSPEPTPDELRDLLGAYALNALDPDERAQVDELLLTDASARAELHELQHAAAWLGHASLRPPAGAWDAIAAEVDRALAEEHAAGEPAHTAPVTPLRSRHVSRWLVAAAAALVLIIGGAGVFAIVDRQSGPSSLTTRYEAALRNPSAHEATLQSADGTYHARAVVLPNHTGYLAEASLPQLPSGRDLQLWSITPAGPVSVGLLRGGGSVHQFRAADGTTTLAVTNEPRGGSPAPTAAPILSGPLGTA